MRTRGERERCWDPGTTGLRESQGRELENKKTANEGGEWQIRTWITEGPGP